MSSFRDLLAALKKGKFAVKVLLERHGLSSSFAIEDDHAFIVKSMSSLTSIFKDDPVMVAFVSHHYVGPPEDIRADVLFLKMWQGRSLIKEMETFLKNISASPDKVPPLSLSTPVTLDEKLVNEITALVGIFKSDKFSASVFKEFVKLRKKSPSNNNGTDFDELASANESVKKVLQVINCSGDSG